MERRGQNDDFKPKKDTLGIQIPDEKTIIITRCKKMALLVVTKSIHRLRMLSERAHRTQATFSIDRIDCDCVTGIHIEDSRTQSAPSGTHLLPSPFHANGVFL